MLAEPIEAINKVASAGPIAKPVAKSPSWIELARSRVILAGAAVSGTKDFRDVEPPGANTALKTPTAINEATVSSQSPAMMGIKITVSAVKSSAQIATKRLPKRSITDPMSGAISNAGIAVIATTKPAVPAEPVSSSATQGKEMNTIDPEMTLVSDASCRKTNGATLRCTYTSFLET